MFSKKLLSEDVLTLNTLQKQQDNCLRLIKESYLDILNKPMNESELELEKSTIYALQDQYDSLNKELLILREQMYLNYINHFAVNHSSKPSQKFRHINTIDS